MHYILMYIGCGEFEKNEKKIKITLIKHTIKNSFHIVLINIRIYLSNPEIILKYIRIKLKPSQHSHHQNKKFINTL